MRENPIRIDDLGVPLFLETPMFFSGTVSTRCRQDSLLQFETLKARLAPRDLMAT